MNKKLIGKIEAKIIEASIHGIETSHAKEIIDLVDQSQWIKVSNRLPEFDIGYLVFVEVVDILNGGSMYINQIAVYSTTDKEWLIDGIVTHWQSLPKQPD